MSKKNKNKKKNRLLKKKNIKNLWIIGIVLFILIMSFAFFNRNTGEVKGDVDVTFIEDIFSEIDTSMEEEAATGEIIEEPIIEDNNNEEVEDLNSAKEVEIEDLSFLNSIIDEIEEIQKAESLTITDIINRVEEEKVDLAFLDDILSEVYIQDNPESLTDILKEVENQNDLVFLTNIINEIDNSLVK